MGKGKTCPDCGHYMVAIKHEDQPKGTWVTYDCRNTKTKCGKVRVFEEK
ncbi:hypothetical protein [Hugenholtzia roseola]|nr:hypothetical protein [Hugenholtzia roseola]